MTFEIAFSGLSSNRLFVKPSDRRPAQIIADGLASYLGPHMARNAVKTFSNKALGRAPELLVRADIPPLLRALKPMLRTLLGAQQTEAVIEYLTKEASA